jgi:N,N'-diacetyllegionaminate synthase
MKIGARMIGNGQPCYIIAEAGMGHHDEQHLNRMWKAERLVKAAAKAGANAVKFQMFVACEGLFCERPGDGQRFQRWNRTHMDLETWAKIKESAEAYGMDFLASAFQPTAVQWLKKLNVAAYKVASRAAATYPYDAVPGPFLISDGMHMVKINPNRSGAIRLQCIPKYPTPLKEARWERGPDADDYGHGLSDHSGTVWPGLDAMARGCPLIELHFAIDKADAGPDAAVCLTVDELKLLCQARDAFAAMRG